MSRPPAPADAASPDSTSQHALEHVWQIHLNFPSSAYSSSAGEDASQLICEFGTVEDFWRYFNHVPRPSRVFTEMGQTGLSKRKIDGKSLEAFAVFKKGVQPRWEDEQNLKGGHWEWRTNEPNLQVLDEVWVNVILGLIGETLEPGAEITGARIVDKCKRGPEYRLEVWARTTDTEVKSRIKEGLEEILREVGPVTDDSGSNVSWKDHQEQVSYSKSSTGAGSASTDGGSNSASSKPSLSSTAKNLMVAHLSS